jgi:hypothetical protein
MTTKPPDRERDPARRPYRVRLPGFVSDEDIGLGDVVTKSTSAFGIKPCGGCAQRAAALNRWVVFGRGSFQMGE